MANVSGRQLRVCRCSNAREQLYYVKKPHALVDMVTIECLELFQKRGVSADAEVYVRLSDRQSALGTKIIEAFRRPSILNSPLFPNPILHLTIAQKSTVVL